jgi:hypothetical protein
LNFRLYKKKITFISILLMKDYNFNYKVSDILRHPETPETIQFSNKFSTLIPQCSDEGISGTIFIQGLNEEQLIIDIKELCCILDSSCDRCWKDLSVELWASWLSYSADFPRKKKKRWEEVVEPDIYIDEKNLAIDLEQIITTDLLLSQSLVNLCLECQKTVETLSEEELE